jgi:hypothetical protein
MARKTNYAFERNNRAKAKAAKREAKKQAKLAAKAEKAGTTSAESIDEDSPTETEDGRDDRSDGIVSPESS